jgi:hypothetical protein
MTKRAAKKPRSKSELRRLKVQKPEKVVGDPEECGCEFEPECNGLGIVHCFCGGDFCVCAIHNGEAECNGCVYCEQGDDDDNDYHPDPEAP